MQVLSRQGRRRRQRSRSRGRRGWVDLHFRVLVCCVKGAHLVYFELTPAQFSYAEYFSSSRRTGNRESCCSKQAASSEVPWCSAAPAKQVSQRRSARVRLLKARGSSYWLFLGCLQSRKVNSTLTLSFNVNRRYRWDGTDRSNGFEHRLLQAMTSSKIAATAQYKWSVSDM